MAAAAARRRPRQTRCSLRSCGASAAHPPCGARARTPSRRAARRSPRPAVPRSRGGRTSANGAASRRRQGTRTRASFARWSVRIAGRRLRSPCSTGTRGPARRDLGDLGRSRRLSSRNGARGRLRERDGDAQGRHRAGGRPELLGSVATAPPRAAGGRLHTLGAWGWTPSGGPPRPRRSRGLLAPARSLERPALAPSAASGAGPTSGRHGGLRLEPRGRPRSWSIRGVPAPASRRRRNRGSGSRGHPQQLVLRGRRLCSGGKLDDGSSRRRRRPG